MSADNWTTCPKCTADAWAAYRVEDDALTAQYGKIPPDEWKAKSDAFPVAPKLEETFREDYEFYGADEGVLSIRYRGRCSECGTGCEFTKDVPFYPEPSA